MGIPRELFPAWKTYASRLRAAAELFEGCYAADASLRAVADNIQPEVSLLLAPINKDLCIIADLRTEAANPDCTLDSGKKGEADSREESLPPQRQEA